jgi:hypothetical protein
VAVKLGDWDAEVRRLHCRSWYCDHCAVHRRHQLYAQAMSGHPNAFLTLTVNPATGTDADDRACRLVDAFQALIKEARRRHPNAPLEFLAVFEKTKRGEPHLHVLLRGPYLEQRWISEFMAARIDAPVCWIRAVENIAKDAGYVAKYISKDPAPFLGTKRYWTSRNYSEHPFEDEEDETFDPSAWDVVKQPAHTVIRAFEAKRIAMEPVGACRWYGTWAPKAAAYEAIQGASP